jgi:hypothetical protein
MNTHVRRAAAVATGLLLSSPSWACGGFFCDLNNRVDQAAERIVFGIDNGKVETHVQITYEGDAAEFAWVVPAPAQPELFTSSQILFDALENVTAPRFTLQQSIVGDDCPMFDASESADSDDSVSDSGQAGGVTLVAEQRVGPYETVTLQATSGEALVAWLQDNAYDVPDEPDDAMAPYIAESSYFVALRLAKGLDTGDLTPLGMRYNGDKPVIPIQLTRIAATPDMGLRVWVLGNGRAVPENYLHVVLNPVAFDWFSLGSNYFDVIRQAADEAGGQAFATDYAGSPEAVTQQFGPELWRRYLDDIRGADSLGGLMDLLQAAGLARYPSTTTAIEDCVTLSSDLLAQGATVQDVLTCPTCWGAGWDSGGGNFDVPGASVAGPTCAALVETRLVEPAASARELLVGSSWMTRLSSSMSPAEMTMDPLFVLNPEMDEVSNIHVAQLAFECDTWTSKRYLTLPDGTELVLPSAEQANQEGKGYLDYVGEAAGFTALRIEQTAATGAPMVLTDNGSFIREALENGDLLPADGTDPGTGGETPSGCGCNAGPNGVAGALALLPFFALRRRRLTVG